MLRLAPAEASKCGTPPIAVYIWLGGVAGAVAPPYSERELRLVRDHIATRWRQPPAEIRRTMIERAQAVRDNLAAKLERNDLGPQARRVALGKLRQIEERLVDPRDPE